MDVDYIKCESCDYLTHADIIKQLFESTGKGICLGCNKIFNNERMKAFIKAEKTNDRF